MLAENVSRDGERLRGLFRDCLATGLDEVLAVAG
jgi:hypothetical protein